VTTVARDRVEFPGRMEFRRASSACGASDRWALRWQDTLHVHIAPAFPSFRSAAAVQAARHGSESEQS